MAKKTFEQAMKLLEQIVQDLESGDMPLEKAIKKFEEGIQLSKYCTEKLDESEKRITILMQDATGNVSEVPFEAHHENRSQYEED
jgi:exodeoxyribonuclease VII small subunit